MPNRSIELASLFVHGARGKVFLLDLVDSWAIRVNRFAKEASASSTPLDSAGGLVEARAVLAGQRLAEWGADAWIGALYTRDHLESTLRDLEIDGVVGTIEVTDELFRRFTVPDESGALRLSGLDDLPSEPWWWRRVPALGPVADDLAAWSRGAEGEHGVMRD